MREVRKIKAPFFEIGIKNYLYGDDVLKLALIADQVSKKYDVDIIFTTPIQEIRRVAENTENIFVFAPYMDIIGVGRGIGEILPEGIKAAGAEGVMLNHAEKPVDIGTMKKAIDRSKEVGLISIVCADSIAEAKAIANLNPDILVAEPSDLIGTGKASDMGYVKESIEAVKSVNPDILILLAAGISNGSDVYNVVAAGADATGSTSGLILAESWEDMADEMIGSVRRAYDERTK